MKQVMLTDVASAMVEQFRDEENTDHIKALTLDLVCSLIDEAEINEVMSREELSLLSIISDYNRLITELSKTSDNN